MRQITLRKLFLMVALVAAALAAVRGTRAAVAAQNGPFALACLAAFLFFLGAAVGVPYGRPIFAGAALVAFVVGLAFLGTRAGVGMVGLAFAALIVVKAYNRAASSPRV